MKYGCLWMMWVFCAQVSAFAQTSGISFYGVFSGDDYGNARWEYFAEKQAMTQKKHMQFPLVEVGIIEWGDAFPGQSVVRMNGKTLPLTRHRDSIGFCWEQGKISVDCGWGQIPAGYIEIWDISGFESGTFEYHAIDDSGTVTAAVYIH